MGSLPLDIPNNAAPAPGGSPAGVLALVAAAAACVAVLAGVAILAWAAALAAIAIGALRAGDGRASRAAKSGEAAERFVVAELAGLDSRHDVLANRVIPGRPGRAPEADVIVARADAVFVLEVKRSVYPVVLCAQGMRRSPDRAAGNFLRDPRGQVLGQVRSVRRFLAHWDIEVPVYSAAVVLAPQVSIQGGPKITVFTTAEAARRTIEVTVAEAGRGGDPRYVLARLPLRQRVRSGQ